MSLTSDLFVAFFCVCVTVIYHHVLFLMLFIYVNGGNLLRVLLIPPPLLNGILHPDKVNPRISLTLSPISDETILK